MPLYEYACPCGYATDQFFAMGEAPPTVEITHVFDEDWAPFHAPCLAARRFSFQYQEDRRHMRSGISGVTGERYAQSRSEERRIEQAKGIEFISRSEMPKQWQKLGDYARHVNAGGERLDPHKVNAPETTSTKGELLRKMAERGVRFGS